jgi:hypothetical protein
VKIPPGKTEEEVLKAIEKAVNILAPSFVFGPYDIDDIKQQGFEFALEVLEKEKYDPEPAARELPLHAPPQPLHQPPAEQASAGTTRRASGATPATLPRRGRRGPLPEVPKWLAGTQSKANLCNPLAPRQRVRRAGAADPRPSTVEQDAETAELLGLIDAKLPIEFRQTYLQMRAGVVSRRRPA